MHAPADHRMTAEQEHCPGAAMIGSHPAVFGHAPPELGQDDHGGFAPERRAEIGGEGGQSRRQAVQPACQPALACPLRHMGIIPAVIQTRRFQTHIAFHQQGDLAKPVA